jgi:hypothetical protein
MTAIIIAIAAAATPATVHLGARFIDRELTAAGVFAVEGSNGLIGFFTARHFHETKAA